MRQFHRRLAPFVWIVVTVLFLLPLSVVKGQQNQASEKEPITNTTASKLNPLDNDPRLRIKVTLKRRLTRVAEALRELSIRTKVKLEAEGNEVRPARLSFSYKDISLKDILDSIAAVHNWEWERRKGGILILRERDNTALQNALRPHSQAQAEIYRKGREFVNLLSKQSQELQNSLWAHPMRGFPLPNGIGFGELPTPMQQVLRDMLAARREELAEQGLDGGHLSPEALDGTRLWMETYPGEGVTSYHLMVFDERGGCGINFNVFSDPNESSQVVPESSPIWYGASEDTTSQEQASNDPRLNQRVTLDVRSETILDALRELAPQVPLNFAAEVSVYDPIKRSFVCKEKPLKAVLDKLAMLYHYTWGYRKSGIFMFHLAPDKSASQ